jgi:hypothetical protein
MLRLERTQTWLAAGITILLFIGLLVLPYWGQVVWVALMGAAWLRVVYVIMKREKLLETATNSGLEATRHQSTSGVSVTDSNKQPWVLGNHLDRQIDLRPIRRSE